MNRVVRLLPLLLGVGLIVLCARLPALPLGPVPVTLQSFAVILAGAVLGPWRGAVAVLLYLGLGLAGAPVFSGGAAGVAVLNGASAGYLLAFPLLALLGGGLVWRVMPAGSVPRPLWLFACGLAWCCIRSGSPGWSARWRSPHCKRCRSTCATGPGMCSRTR